MVVCVPVVVFVCAGRWLVCVLVCACVRACVCLCVFGGWGLPPNAGATMVCGLRVAADRMG